MKNADKTRERILKAAAVEFVTYGIAGGRVNRIAKNAKANKNLIYVYFGNKEQLATAVLARHLKNVFDTVPFTANDLPAYAAGLFDLAMDHPDLERLIMWCGLEGRTDWLLDELSSIDVQLKGIAQAQRNGIVAKDFSPKVLLTLIFTISSAWAVVSPYGLSIEPNAAKRRDVLRKAVSQAIEQLCRVHPADADSPR